LGAGGRPFKSARPDHFRAGPVGSRTVRPAFFRRAACYGRRACACSSQIEHRPSSPPADRDALVSRGLASVILPSTRHRAAPLSPSRSSSVPAVPARARSWARRPSPSLLGALGLAAQPSLGRFVLAARPPRSDGCGRRGDASLGGRSPARPLNPRSREVLLEDGDILVVRSRTPPTSRGSEEARRL
jgi:hypothetical protein